jgi:hypothetical protein
MAKKNGAVRLSADEVAHFETALRGTKKKSKKVSGPSGRNTKPGVLLRSEDIPLWRKFAAARGVTLSKWIRGACQLLIEHQTYEARKRR